MHAVAEDPPMGFPEAAEPRWEKLYRQAADLYGAEYAGHVATKLSYDLVNRATGRARPRPVPGKLPNPHGMIGLGYTLQVTGVYWGEDTIVSPLRLHAPFCLWSEHLHAVLSFPGLKMPAPVMSPHQVPELLRLYRTWHNGKDPKIGASRVRVPDPVFTDVLAGAIIAYSSDKFDADGDFHTYVHHFELGPRGQPGPLVYVSRECIMVRGGFLRLTRDGLAG